MKIQAAYRSSCSPLARLAPGLLIALATVGLGGCSGDDPQVQQRTVPAPAPGGPTTTAPPGDPAPETGGPYGPAHHDHQHAHPGPTAQPVEEPGDRLVAALVEHPQGAWTLRILGPAAEVATEAQHFVELLQSLEFPADDPTPHYTLAEHWEPSGEGGDAGRRYRTGEAVELRVERHADAEPLEAVNRFRDELGQEPITSDELERYAMPMTVSELDLTLIDLITHAPATDGTEAEGDADRVIYDVPAGWLHREAEGMRLASLAIVEGDEAADISIVALAGDGGGLVANVNRWREQLALEPTDAAGLEDDAFPVEMNREQAVLIDLHAADRESRMLVAIQRQGGQTYFVRMHGPSDLVAEQQDAFEAFLRSVRLPDSD